MNATERLAPIRERETALIWDRALRRHDTLCLQGSGCLSRESHAQRASVHAVRLERIAEIEAKVFELQAALAILRRAAR